MRDVELLQAMVLAYRVGFESGLKKKPATVFAADVERRACELGHRHAADANEFFQSAISAASITANDEADSSRSRGAR